MAGEVRATGTRIAPAAGAGAEAELPLAVADGESAVDGLADEAGADGALDLAEQGGPADEKGLAEVAFVVGDGTVFEGRLRSPDSLRITDDAEAGVECAGVWLGASSGADHVAGAILVGAEE